jgi:lipopolysaccharide/colanic/teichoic acid biosynthesis glycosyltransferase
MSKRQFDLVVTLATSWVWVPSIAIAALTVALREGRPVFYTSPRVVGLKALVRVTKFRTMVRNADTVFNRVTVPVTDGLRFLNMPVDSPLYTPTGRVLERIAFTELPQLWLVLKGDMSLVGNRPLPANVMESLSLVHPTVYDRLLTPAGMAGPVQLIGRERLTDRERLALEAMYCRIALQTSTWRLDFLILLYTVLQALRLKGPMSVAGAREFMLRVSGVQSQSVEFGGGFQPDETGD